MSTHLFMALLLAAIAPREPPNEASWPTMSVGAAGEQVICAIDPSTWERTWRGHPQAVEVCVYGNATVGGAPVTHSTARIEWRCGAGSAARSSVAFYQLGRREPVAIQREGYGTDDGAATPCASWNSSAARADREDAEAFVSRQLAAWGGIRASPPFEGNPSRWTEWPAEAGSGVGCALALEDLMRRERVAIGRFACVYDPEVYTPHRLGAGRDGQPLHFRHERGFVAARCDLRQLYWSQGEYFETAQDRTPYRAGSRDDGLYLGPFARYRGAQDAAILELLCADQPGPPTGEGDLDQFVRTRLAAWGEA